MKPMKRLKQALRSVTLPKLLVVLILSLGLSGCSALKKDVILHPIEKSHIFSIEEGSKVIHTDGSETVAEKSGWFLSDYYLEEVSKAKIGR